MEALAIHVIALTASPGLGAVVKNLEKVVEQLTTRSCNLIFNIRNYAVEK